MGWEEYEEYVHKLVSDIYSDSKWDIIHEGLSNSNVPDLLFINGNEEKKVEIKNTPAQSGQLVVIVERGVTKIDFKNDNSFNSKVIHFINEGETEKTKEEIASMWIKEKYADQAAIIYGDSIDTFVTKVSELDKYLFCDWKVRVKKSGTRHLTKKLAEGKFKNYVKKINKKYIAVDPDDKIFKCDDIFVNDNNEVKIKSKTANLNIVFNVKMKENANHKQVSEITKLIAK